MMVLDRQVDVAVAVEYRGAPGEDDARLTRVPLYAEPFDAVLPPGHRLAAGERVALGDLAKDAWIGQSAGNPCHDVTVLACEYAGFTLNPEHSSDDFRAVVALAAASAGVALVPRSALRGMELTGVEVRPIEGVAPTRRVFAAVRRGAEDHPLISPVLTALGVASESGA
jgi:DNA-binding transcriptional LysR family regulator